MVDVQEFLSKCKPLPNIEEKYKISKEDENIKIEIIKYLLNNKSQVNYTQRIFDKLEIVLNDLLIRSDNNDRK